ncbi:hypothetical protein ACHAWO_010228 [Cyclotella atomus]|uniref:Uncharacterized protein n=1 Tax=Cyclotella atomus TaxID=382360 RepID=A0ABD3Q8D7_9STRA
MLTVLFFIITTCILSAVNGFSPSQTRHSSFIIKTHNYLRINKRRSKHWKAAVESSEEIKGDNTQSDAQVVEEEEPEWEVLKRQSNDSVMLSERWKEASDPSPTSADGEMLKNAAIALGLVVFLRIFSQVPIGNEAKILPIGNEDLQKYQDYKGSASRIDLGDLNDARMQ